MIRFSVKITRTLATLITCVILISCLCLTAFAASDPSKIDVEATGSLELKPKRTDNEAIVTGGTFDIYKVASLVSTVPLRYELVDAFATEESGYLNVEWIKEINQKGLDFVGAKVNADAAAAFEKLITSEKAADFTLDSRNGYKAEGLDQGVYLVVNSRAIADYTKAVSFLVFMPTTEANDTGWVYDITAYPKISYDPYIPPPTSSPSPPQPPTLTPDPSEPPIELTEPSPPLQGLEPPPSEVVDDPTDFGEDIPPLAGLLPQTGMLQWPIPVLSLLGVGFIITGSLYGRGKKKTAE